MRQERCISHEVLQFVIVAEKMLYMAEMPCCSIFFVKMLTLNGFYGFKVYHGMSVL